MVIRFHVSSLLLTTSTLGQLFIPRSAQAPLVMAVASVEAMSRLTIPLILQNILLSYTLRDLLMS